MGALVKLGLSFFGGKTWLLIVAAIAALYVGFLHLSIAGLKRDVAERDVTIERQAADLHIARGNLDTAVAVNATNAIELAKIKKAESAARTAFANERRRAQERCAIDTRMTEEIRRAEVENPATCPVSDSLRAVVDGLRDLIEGSADRDEDRDGAGPPAR